MTTPRPDLLALLDDPGGAGDVLLDEHRRLTHADLVDDVLALAAALARRGVVEGDRVAVTLGNRVEAVELYLACALLGAIWVGISPGSPAAERARQLNLVAPRLLVTDELVAELAAHHRGAEEFPLPDLNLPCAVGFTSGTTSAPKAVVHSRAGVSLAAAALGQRNGVRIGDRVGAVLPLSIHNVLLAAAVAPMMHGACAAPVPTMSARGVAQAVRAHALTTLALVPATIYDLVHDDTLGPGSLSTLRFVGTGAAGLPEELRSAFEAKFGVPLRSAYGMTEAPGPVAMEELGGPHRPGGSGSALPHVSISVGDDSEFLIAAAPSGPFAGLFRPPLGNWTSNGLQRWADPDVVRTGDYGSIDPDGTVRVTSRRTGVVVRGGVNIDVGEVESVLSELPGVRGIAVVGRADARLGERIVAFVETGPAPSCDPETLRRQAGSLLSHAKVPDEFVLVEGLPRNAMGKVERPRLAEVTKHRRC